MQQNGEAFSFIPLTPLKIYNGDPVNYEQIPDIIQTHIIVRQSGVPNFLGARIPVTYQLNPERWCSHLAEF